MTNRVKLVSFGAVMYEKEMRGHSTWRSAALAVAIIMASAACSYPALPRLDSFDSVDAPPPVVTPPLALDCGTYCTHIAADCTAANAQITAANCMGTCAAFPRGAQTDTSGNTLGCRNYHLQNIEVRNMSADTHCAHAGPVGATLSAATGVCGATSCDNFCAMEAKICGTDAAPVTGITNRYPDTAACMTACFGFAKTPEYGITTTSGNNLACRFYHLTNAAAQTIAAAVNTHCGHTLANATAQCM